MRRKHVKVTAKVTLHLTYKSLLLPDEFNKKELSFYARVLSTSPAYIEKTNCGCNIRKRKRYGFIQFERCNSK